MSNPFEALDNKLDQIQKSLDVLLENHKVSFNSSMNNERNLINRKEASQYLGISESTLRRIEKSGAIKTVRMGASVRFDWVDIEEYRNRSK